MSDKKKLEQPIVVKKSRRHGGHHGGAWKVAYADFVTAMMAFFLVMWLVSQSDEVKQSVAAYFNDPVAFKKGGNTGVFKGEGPSIIDPKRMSNHDRQKAEEMVKRELTRAADEIRNALSQIPEFESLKDKIDIKLTGEGLRIQLIESSGDKDSSFFGLGRVELNAKGKVIVQAIAKELAKLNNKIVVEGHTDSRIYLYSKEYSNWELSADRANNTRKIMEENGLSDDRFEAVRGYADKRLRIPENPLDPRNRRISILVLNDYAEFRYNELEASEWTLKK